MTTTSLSPTDLHSACEAMAETHGTVRISGADSAHGWAGAPRPTDTVVGTTALTGVLAYNPADMTIAVRAGTRMADLQAEVAQHGQRIAFDAARVRRGATVGGLVATADSGPLALGFGSLRDLVIGATVVLPDATVARTGGHVIKNVAGYDLAKLLHGSYGAFGLLAEVVLRLHPVPPAERTVRLTCTLEEGTQHARTLMASALEPVSLEWADGALLARIEGTDAGTSARAAELADLIGGAVLSEDEAATEWERHAELVDRADVRIGCRPSRLPTVLDACDSAVVAGLATGVATAAVPASRIDEVHDVVTAAGGTSVTRTRQEQRRAWGRHPSALSVVRALKHELDPARRLCDGRFETWFEPSAPTAPTTTASTTPAPTTTASTTGAPAAVSAHDTATTDRTTQEEHS